MDEHEPRLELRISAFFSGMEFSLVLDYVSVVEEVVEFNFQNNRSGRLERALLQILDPEGRKRINRSRYRYFSYRSHGRLEPIRIQPHETFTYVLKGVYDGTRLNFRAASYDLLPGKTYIVMVHSHLLKSNEIEVTMPVV